MKQRHSQDANLNPMLKAATVQSTLISRIFKRGSICERMGFPVGQVILLLLLFGVGIALILSMVQQAVLSTLFLLGFVSVAGLVLCRNTQARLNDPALKVLGYFWLIKLGLTLFSLYVSWIPLLATGSGYDPIKYYFQAQELIDNNWSADVISLNYVGILYYYGAMLYVLGHNPVIPALINTFVTLIATLYLIKVGYEIKGQKNTGDWTLAFALLLPEVVWYDVMTARETLMAALLLFEMLTIGRYFARAAPVTLPKVFIVMGLSSLAIATVRTSMLLPLFLAIVLMAFLIRPQHGPLVKQRIWIVIAGAVALVFGKLVNQYIGGNAVDIIHTLFAAISAKDNVALGGGMEYSKNSISLLLMPNGLLQAILYVPLRMVLYLIAPLPHIIRPIGELLSGDVGQWQTLFTILSSVVNLFAFPYALAGSIHALIRRKENAGLLVFHLSYWCTFLAIAGGNLIVQERYRVMASLLLWGCAWLGARTCTKHLIIRTSIFWYGLLTLSAFLYLAYKFT